jgi:hypothetical protein
MSDPASLGVTIEARFFTPSFTFFFTSFFTALFTSPTTKSAWNVATTIFPESCDLPFSSAPTRSSSLDAD